MCQVLRFGFRAYYLSPGNRITYPSKGLKRGREDTKKRLSRGWVNILPCDHVPTSIHFFFGSLECATRRVSQGRWSPPMAADNNFTQMQVEHPVHVQKSEIQNTSCGIPGRLHIPLQYIWKTDGTLQQ